MAGVAFTNPAGGAWPLGLITVTTAGTPVPINGNVGAQGQSGMQMARRIRQLIICPKSSNTKPVYLVWKGYDRATKTNGVILVVPAGTIGEIPRGSQFEASMPSLDNYYLDSEVNGEGAFITAIYG